MSGMISSMGSRSRGRRTWQWTQFHRSGSLAVFSGNRHRANDAMVVCCNVMENAPRAITFSRRGIRESMSINMPR